MAQETQNQQWVERRAFPRIKGSCPVRYTAIQGRPEWLEAELADYSATGVRMVCRETLLHNTSISLQLLPGGKPTIPRISAQAVVVRCHLNADHQYEVACKLTRVMRASNTS